MLILLISKKEKRAQVKRVSLASKKYTPPFRRRTQRGVLRWGVKWRVFLSLSQSKSSIEGEAGGVGLETWETQERFGLVTEGMGQAASKRGKKGWLRGHGGLDRTREQDPQGDHQQVSQLPAILKPGNGNESNGQWTRLGGFWLLQFVLLWLPDAPPAWSR